MGKKDKKTILRDQSGNYKGKSEVIPLGEIELIPLGEWSLSSFSLIIYAFFSPFSFPSLPVSPREFLWEQTQRRVYVFVERGGGEKRILPATRSLRSKKSSPQQLYTKDASQINYSITLKNIYIYCCTLKQICWRVIEYCDRVWNNCVKKWFFPAESGPIAKKIMICAEQSPTN